MDSQSIEWTESQSKSQTNVLLSMNIKPYPLRVLQAHLVYSAFSSMAVLGSYSWFDCPFTCLALDSKSRCSTQLRVNA